MNDLERTLKRVTSTTLMAFADALDAEFGDEDRLGDTAHHLLALGLEIEAVTQKILRNADVFPGLQNRRMKAR
jgi:hypothetical protein